ncbi:hypothetical protein A3C09_03760 [Candidatus Uhrbacteria bacterium RIFCSPHIGHO2_02_FULL_47_44]|uniref:Uncharacterized protein n=1 Tax=Candidatus Uhrbacteria bacterium RIFCSPLOWO2_02_FULL_48_18 TaxID=1802408 RepID=A0A1F7VCK9_9BACT|nr:MAG: hypothetical protein A2839_00755 [Candidatus Uhrbacteria bacterium RIFCSPHIGHO2_01_FULL_47_10]OGL71795.1 MAG: hypothetical protein A3C09_03760 [Candidatus Uhrbacteria bacterium RIFCSPHIGHO2_02_FULL_47_44]OGL77813.1 MAG: hypothetical protein A3E97_02530 [Candidatus Uhrbacteria bacterium RIFCSPHIGHO2_12_FULL_47_12]OGL80632.1 MAG: hypothetical protein A3B20_04525 [Candidatus Uhrbacteria bacterium RIFCSPLOWO2_01_FULL_47_17]OGL88185.1 MAG: hypothetical protein A3I41_00455 [Candidatus Uhrbact
MKVLEYPDMTWTEEVVCKKCTSRLLVEIPDILREKYQPFRFYANCPVCHESVFAVKPLPWYVEAHARGNHVGWPPGKHPKPRN